MKFIAEVKTDDGEWIKINNVRWIALDENGKPERVCGPSGLQYGEFRLGIDPTDKDKQAGWVRYEDAEPFDMLKELEWSGKYMAGDGSEIDWSCPVCKNERYQGHKGDCRLREILIGGI